MISFVVLVVLYVYGMRQRWDTNRFVELQQLNQLEESLQILETLLYLILNLVSINCEFTKH